MRRSEPHESLAHMLERAARFAVARTEPAAKTSGGRAAHVGRRIYRTSPHIRPISTARGCIHRPCAHVGVRARIRNMDSVRRRVDRQRNATEMLRVAARHLHTKGSCAFVLNDESFSTLSCDAGSFTAFSGDGTDATA